MSAEVRLENSRLSATNLTIDAIATKTMLVTPDSAFGGNLTFAEAILAGSSEVTIIGGVITATTNLAISSQSTLNTTVGRNPANDGNTNDNDQQQDAAVVLTTIDNDVSVNISGAAVLSAGVLGPYSPTIPSRQLRMQMVRRVRQTLAERLQSRPSLVRPKILVSVILRSPRAATCN